VHPRDEIRNQLIGAGLSQAAAERGADYWLLVSEENSRQNLTRLIEPKAFFDGHVVDVLELRRLRLRAMSQTGEAWVDLGPGAGVPGLLSAALFDEERWILIEAEKRKAEFLETATKKLGLESAVQVQHARIEMVCSELQARTIVSKAVGSVGKIYNWIKGCSTWNNLILFKGPKWEDEWQEFKLSPNRDRLEIITEHRYSTPQGAQRVIIQLGRVPRGTMKIIKKG
jgi:16S rRNA (guanine(527)-N(7))-methyltransferase RsmG